MRALVLRDFWDLAVEERADPQPAPGEVVVRVTATGICGSDVHGFTGENGRRRPGQVMGHEMVGRVHVEPPAARVAEGLHPGAVVTVNPVLACGSCPACAAGREQACPGKRVIGVHPDISSGFAELIAVPAGNLVALPASMPEEYGALVEPLAVGFHAARRGGCGPADRVLVVGGGPIGQACVLAAGRLGAAAVAVSEPDAYRRELVSRLGAVPLDPSAGAVRTLPGHVADALGGPATLVLDAVGSTASLRDALECAVLGGRVVLVGMAAPRPELAAYAISTEERSLIGSFCYSADEFRATARWVGAAPPELSCLIDERVGLDGANDAFTRLAGGDSQASKILVLPGRRGTGESPS